MELIIPNNKFSMNGFSYKGSRHDRFRDYGCPPPATKTEEDILNASDRQKAIARLYDLYRNNEIVQAIVEAYVSSVGNVQFRATENIVIEDFFFDWFEELEITGENLSSVLRQTVIQLLLAGEVFINLTKGGKVQLIEAGQIYSSPKERIEGESQGIIRDKNLLVTGYRLHGDTILKAENVVHIFRKDRPSQIRGIPWLLGAVPALQDLDEILEARNVQIKNAAMLVGVRKSPDPWQDGSAQQQGTIRAGTILEIANDEAFDFIESRTNADDFSSFLRSRITQILATIGLPYEVVYGFDSNYASSKGTRSQFITKIKEVRRFFEKKLLTPIYRWKHEKEALPELGVYNWSWSMMSALDPERDARTAKMLLENKLSTKADIYAEQGKYWEEELEQYYAEVAFEEKMKKKYQLVDEQAVNNDE